MKKPLKYTKQIIENKKFVYIGVFLSFFLLVLSLALTYHIRSYNSDDVGIQNALLSWTPFNHQTLYLSPDTWIINIPFYEVFQHLFAPSRGLVFVEGVFFAVINLALFYVAVKYFYNKLKIKFNIFTILPILWVASFGYYYTILFLNTNLRNFEIGLTFILFMLVSKILSGEFDPLKSVKSILLSVLFCALIGVLILNDPMFLYYGVLPLIILVFIFYLKSPGTRRIIRTIFYGLLLSGVFYEITKFIVIKSGIDISPQPISFVHFSSIFSNLSTATHGLILLFGANIFGRAVLNLATICSLLNLVLLGLIIYIIFSSTKLKPILKSTPIDSSSIIKHFFAWLSVYIFIIYVISNQLLNLYTYRYLVMLPFIAIILLAGESYFYDKNIKNLIGMVLILSIVFNVGTLLAYSKAPNIVSYGSVTNQPNSLNFNLIKVLEAKGLYKGYSQYWDANITSYLSNNKIDISPVVCSDYNKTIPFNWFVAGNQLNKPSKNSFIILDYTGTPMCTMTSISSQFGKPESSFSIDGLKILVYNYDIGSILKAK